MWRAGAGLSWGTMWPEPRMVSRSSSSNLFTKPPTCLLTYQGPLDWVSLKKIRNVSRLYESIDCKVILRTHQEIKNTVKITFRTLPYGHIVVVRRHPNQGKIFLEMAHFYLIIYNRLTFISSLTIIKNWSWMRKKKKNSQSFYIRDGMGKCVHCTTV